MNFPPNNTMPQSSSDAGGLSLYKSLKVYNYLAAAELTLAEIRYQGSGTDLFKEHKAIMLCFLIVVFVYAVTQIKMTFQSSNDNNLSFRVCLGHVCGTVACELLLFVIVTPVEGTVINLSIISVVALYFFYQQAPVLLSLVGTCCFGIPAESTSTSTNGEEQPEVEMVDEEEAAA